MIAAVADDAWPVTRLGESCASLTVGAPCLAGQRDIVSTPHALRRTYERSASSSLRPRCPSKAPMILASENFLFGAVHSGYDTASSAGQFLGFTSVEAD